MTVAIVFKILMIIFSCLLAVSLISYMFECHRYIHYLEKQLEDKREKDIREAWSDEKNSPYNGT